MKFEEWWKDVSDAYFDSTDTYPNNVTKNFSRAAWEAAQPGWHPIETAPQNKRVLVKSKCGYPYFAKHFAARTLPANSDLLPLGWADYDEGNDEYWCPEGWYKDVGCSCCEAGYWEVEEHLAPVAWMDVERLA